MACADGSDSSMLVWPPVRSGLGKAAGFSVGFVMETKSSPKLKITSQRMESLPHQLGPLRPPQPAAPTRHVAQPRATEPTQRPAGDHMED